MKAAAAGKEEAWKTAGQKLYVLSLGIGFNLSSADRNLPPPVATPCSTYLLLLSFLRGLEIWRVVQFQIVPWTEKGNFFSGDSYIVLHVLQRRGLYLIILSRNLMSPEKTYKKTPKDEKLSYNVHFWLGKETSQDEAGTAAYKTVELDDCMNRQWELIPETNLSSSPPPPSSRWNPRAVP